MAIQEMAHTPEAMPPGMMASGEKKERVPKYRVPLRDGSVLVAYDDADLMKKMGEYRDNAN